MSKNDNIKIITGDPKKAIVKLAIPMMISMLLIMMYNIADSIWVAGLGADALAAIGFITPLFMVLVGLGNGIGAGANSLIARNIGAKNYKQANNSGLHAILLSVIVSVIFTILIEGFMVPILQFMGAGDTIQYAMDYSYIIFGFLFIFVYSGVASAIFRSEGDMKRSTIAIAITAVLNIILDPIFIYILNLGIAGAAWATVISATMSCVIMSYWIWGKKDLYLDLSLKNFDYQTSLMVDTLQVAIPSTLENIVFSALAIIINSMLVLAAGTTAVAVYTASMRIVQLAMIPLIGLGTAVLTVAGVAYGAHNYKNLKTAHSYSIKVGFLISIILGAIMFVFSSPIATIFSYTAASASLSPQIATAISVLSLFVLAIPHGIMSSMMFQGVGKGTYSLLITLLRSLILETVFAYLFCFTFGWGLTGIYAGVVFGCFVGGTIGYVWAKLFIRRFKQIAIRKYAPQEN
ncbi:MAG: MATE family efflux transporter [archaeon]|uniref:Putative MATE family efflux protein n=1 Tax=Methanobrevibacter gottschalkii DSM 11977 TaxID=1122229 RepID=A0A3N5C6I8_9EURY|nr:MULTISPECIES: MATE family efflux transporter [Methanobrevibacter]MCQ2970758.1 MATE family efflux transporter [archaeon]OEC94452.1 MATE family efflux transporter [Methanobrevibacter sp. A27]RPF52021.1 putative MATE family efflux protein [Methanobrevibacter gottschalkii DSM 11977]